jgi:hypothetical protein
MLIKCQTIISNLKALFVFYSFILIHLSVIKKVTDCPYIYESRYDVVRAMFL